MTSFDSNPMNALEGLLEERRRYEGWLAQLEARRAESPSHVVDRVRSDYLTRLESVVEKLRGRAEELTSSAVALRERIATLAGEETVRRDERAELELRALVGEFAPEEAQHAMATCDEAIGRLSEERGGLEGELSRLTEVLASLAEPQSVSATSDTFAPEGRTVPGHELPTVGEHDEFESQERFPAAALESTSLPSTERSALAELAFLESVVSSTSESIPAAAAGNEGHGDLVAESVSEHAAEQAPASSGARAEANSDLLPPPVLSAPRRPVTPLSTSIPATRDPFGGGTAASTLTPGSIPSFLKDMPTEQVKTLKCQECGTMNYPTEWYCERCGGELAAM